MACLYCASTTRCKWGFISSTDHVNGTASEMVRVSVGNQRKWHSTGEGACQHTHVKWHASEMAWGISVNGTAPERYAMLKSYDYSETEGYQGSLRPWLSLLFAGIVISSKQTIIYHTPLDNYYRMDQCSSTFFL